ncbi:MAG TPA: DUF1223 domain-containing protein [Dyella sp.]|uniref:DUF1223 domain-containing protein n=1 Tax=Dyella sp. TaxID=1869338 RepID=UPI002BB01BFB|nr:DUF1223 domain-containing protein [Dyella sp.]HTV85956.1 DUF1223 domain-containing protein [Dyella sp.]
MTKRRPYYLSAALCAWFLYPSAWAQSPSGVDTNNLTVVELFQSQGCSSCPPAEENLNAVAGNPHVLALSFGVTYWDDLGWKDTFATDAYTQRQWRYAHYRHRDTVWTPQVYVNGHADLVGNNRFELNEAISEAQSSGPSIVWPSANHVQIKASTRPLEPSEVWLVRYDPRTLHVPIGGGENGGRTLDQRNVVRELVRLGEWRGDDAAFSLPAPSLAGLQTAVLVQVQNGGDILSASVEPVGDSGRP